MLRALRASGVAAILALSIVGPGALVAAGDDGPPRAAPTGRPTRTVLRPAELPDQAPPIVAKQSDKILVLLVGGINSRAADPTFDPLINLLRQDPKYDVRVFGGDPEHPYDALGPLDPSARSLIAEIGELHRQYPAGIHIVAHSMGGAVVDRAIADGLSASDGVTTYIALASPHSGSTAAAIAVPTVALAGPESLELRAAFAVSPLHLDPGRDAARDLSVRLTPRPSRGIVRLDLRMANDETVLGADARDPGVDSRILLPLGLTDFEGHGAILHDRRALDLVASTIAHSAAPPDDRLPLEKAQAAMWSAIFDLIMPNLLLLAAAAALACAFAGFCVPLLKAQRRQWAANVLKQMRR